MTTSWVNAWVAKSVVKHGIVLLSSLVFLALFGCARPEPPSIESPAQLTPAAPPKPWLLVDTKNDSLTVMRGDQIIERFNNIAVGSSGVGIKRQRGDDITPLGVFKVGWINPHSRFELFVGLNYPNLTYITQAYEEKRIDKATYEQARQALLKGYVPPQDTLLGGQIGIHGVGAGDLDVHRNFNWTDGCIALDNQQIQRLAVWVEEGTRVVIR